LIVCVVIFFNSTESQITSQNTFVGDIFVDGGSFFLLQALYQQTKTKTRQRPLRNGALKSIDIITVATKCDYIVAQLMK